MSIAQSSERGSASLRAALPRAAAAARGGRGVCRAAPVAGFTLLEMLVAITILGIILVSVYGVLSRALFAKDYAEGRAELYAAGREAVLKMSEEIEAALPPSVRAEVNFRALTHGDRPPTDAVQFSINTHSGMRSIVPRSGRSTITYSLDPLQNSNDVFALRRDELPLVGSQSVGDDESSEEVPTPQPTGVYLLDPADCTEQRFCVVGLRLRFLDPKSGDWVSEWDSTQPLQLNKLPAAAEIGLFLADAAGSVHDFTTIVDLVLAASSMPTPTPGPATGGGR